jgi:hypothetical protein
MQPESQKLRLGIPATSHDRFHRKQKGRSTKPTYQPIAHRDRIPPQQLLRLRLQLGSQKSSLTSCDAATQDATTALFVTHVTPLRQ